jgi:dihydrofolate synthase/folylpolyglutamate synthase
MIRAAADLVDEFVVTTAPSDRTTDPDSLAATVVGVVGPDRVVVEPDVEQALRTARELAEEHADAAAPADSAVTSLHDAPEPAGVGPQPGVVVFGSITLVAKAIELVREHGWP